MRARSLAGLVLGLVLADCGAVVPQSTTTTTVAASDIPATKYHKIAIFAEGAPEDQRFWVESTIAKAFAPAGVTAIPSMMLFNNTPNQYSDLDKGRIIHDQQFDGVLYFSVKQSGEAYEPVPGAWYDGQMFHRSANIPFVHVEWASSLDQSYQLDERGNVVRPVWVIAGRTELQDVVSAKVVWSSDTKAFGNKTTTTIASVLEQAADDMIHKLRTANAI